MRFTNPDPDVESDRKTILYCQGCNRSAPIGEGWSTNRRNGRQEIDCPNCETVLVSQPYFETETKQPPITA